MGNGRQYNKSGGFSDYLYEGVGEKVTINGVTGRMIESITHKDGDLTRLPTYSSTSDIYFKRGEDGLASQAKLYVDRKMVMDFDWSHSHTNKKDGVTFEKGTVHVQEYVDKGNGKFKRLSHDARRMTPAEIQKYGPIIRHFNSNVQF